MGKSKAQREHDPVDNPVHYTRHSIEPITVIEEYGLGPGFHIGNAIKYVSRADTKGDAILDLKKALWYLQRAVDIYSAKPLLGFSPDTVIKDWKLGPQLGLVIRYLVEGKWTAAHLMLATEINHREQLNNE